VRCLLVVASLLLVGCSTPFVKPGVIVCSTAFQRGDNQLCTIPLHMHPACRIQYHYAMVPPSEGCARIDPPEILFIEVVCPKPCAGGPIP
jgi:hypothetical protein